MFQNPAYRERLGRCPNSGLMHIIDGDSFLGVMMVGRFRILSFDGGGIRGALTVRLLKRLAEKHPNIAVEADLLAGTSTGSLIALGLAKGMTLDELVRLYSKESGEKIFSPRYRALLRPRYSNRNLAELLSSAFGETLRLGDLPRTVVIPAFRITGGEEGRWSPVFFHNFPGSAYLDMRVVDVGLASSAAPVYFPSHQDYVDGGVIATNPSTAAIAITRDAKAGKRSIADITLLSIGTGYDPLSIDYPTTNWGALEWAIYPHPPVPLLSLLLDGSAEADTWYSAMLLGENYFRLNPRLTEPIDMDEYEKVSLLDRLARECDLEPCLDWIEQRWYEPKAKEKTQVNPGYVVQQRKVRQWQLPG